MSELRVSRKTCKRDFQAKLKCLCFLGENNHNVTLRNYSDHRHLPSPNCLPNLFTNEMKQIRSSIDGIDFLGKEESVSSTFWVKKFKVHGNIHYREKKHQLFWLFHSGKNLQWRLKHRSFKVQPLFSFMALKKKL